MDTVGFNEESWLDQDGHPHTEALHTIERFTRINAVQMRYEVTIDDPFAYTANWTPEPPDPVGAGRRTDGVHLPGKQ